MSSTDKAVVFCDGGSRGNPGPSASGVVIKTTKDEKITEFSKYLGVQTNNFAEYTAVILALDWLIEHGYKEADFFLDSQLIVRQLSGQYKVKNVNIKPLYDQVQTRLDKLNTTFEHVYRKDNTEADAMVNQCLDALNLDK